MLDPKSTYFWYGDSFARRGFVVLALDISHRPVEDRRGLYSDTVDGDDPANSNGAHPSIKAQGFDSDWEEDGERVWDTMRALDYLLSLPYVDNDRVLVTGLSLGGEVTAQVAALDPRIGMSIPAGYSPDMGVMLYSHNHPCWRWINADIREYIDTSDFFALTAPRPLIIQTGKKDRTFSSRSRPFASDKQIARKVRVAYGGEVHRFIHYLHYNGHHYHVGDLNPIRSTEQSLRAAKVIEPTAPWSTNWQTDNRTSQLGATLFDYSGLYLGL